eukprot:CAMPEP_0113601078 /NCGR_PEP_ID=MMETSP0017_2-20120614/42_1 /TAXON_ID=2856 /ORGANISM="Cylindrotheca closterium" /LENGTH=211 /DNA_ID=CAMNT_0000509357 /DNA_START=56 /DNA_END=691 /DNA_ORIENTATION=+ /assembly_acc=CAM_ASM_000147
MNEAKEKWDSSNVSKAVNSAVAAVPQGTKDFLSSTTGELFDRKNLRGFKACFGMGEDKPFSSEKSFGPLKERVTTNLTFFYLNYVLFGALVFCLTMIGSPSAIIGIGALAVVWFLFIQRAKQNKPITILGKELTDKQATDGLILITAVVLFFILEGVFWYALGTTVLLTILHAATRSEFNYQEVPSADDELAKAGEASSLLNSAAKVSNVV